MKEDSGGRWWEACDFFFFYQKICTSVFIYLFIYYWIVSPDSEEEADDSGVSGEVSAGKGNETNPGQSRVGRKVESSQKGLFL